MIRRLSDSGHFKLFRGEVTSAEMLSHQYIRFCPTDAWRPNINMYETREAFIICVDLAGMKPDAINLEYGDGAVILRGERLPPAPSGASEDIGVQLMEIDSGQFCRQVDLPAPVERDRMTASYRDGILWITLVKAQA